MFVIGALMIGLGLGVAGYRMVELTLQVRPEDGVPFHAKRKFSVGRLEQGRRGT